MFAGQRFSNVALIRRRAHHNSPPFPGGNFVPFGWIIENSGKRGKFA